MWHTYLQCVSQFQKLIVINPNPEHISLWINDDTTQGTRQILLDFFFHFLIFQNRTFRDIQCHMLAQWSNQYWHRRIRLTFIWLILFVYSGFLFVFVFFFLHISIVCFLLSFVLLILCKWVLWVLLLTGHVSYVKINQHNHNEWVKKGGI